MGLGIFVPPILKFQIWCRSDHLFFAGFSKVSTEVSNCSDIDSSVLSFLGFTVETDVEVDEGSARAAG